MLTPGQTLLAQDADLITSMVRKLHENLKIPVTCKIRILDDDEATLKLAKRLQEAGCSMLCVHGRTREMLQVPLKERTENFCHSSNFVT